METQFSWQLVAKPVGVVWRAGGPRHKSELTVAAKSGQAVRADRARAARGETRTILNILKTEPPSSAIALDVKWERRKQDGTTLVLGFCGGITGRRTCHVLGWGRCGWSRGNVKSPVWGILNLT